MSEKLIAHEQSILKIGNVYSVAHAVLEVEGSIHNVPVNPFLHKDPQFGADFYHYHIDGRFVMDAWTRWYFELKEGFTNYAIKVPCYQYKFLRIEYFYKKCVRLTTGTKPPMEVIDYRKPIYHGDTDKFTYKKKKSLYSKWYDTMIGKSCAGRKCPHMGTVMIESDGVLMCPMHNLKGSIETEKIIEY